MLLNSSLQEVNKKIPINFGKFARSTLPMKDLVNNPDEFIKRFEETGYEFGSDIFAPPDPLALKLITLTNSVNTGTYQNGRITKHARKVFQKYFGSSENDVAVWFTTSGTGANRVSTALFLQNIDMILAADISHAYGREAGAPHILNSGASVRIIPSNKEGKITVKALKNYLTKEKELPSTNNRIRMLTISQPTELGTLYSMDEVKELSKIAHENNMYFQIDGARLFYAAAALNKSLKQITTDLNVDITTVGGSKNLLRKAEAAVFLPNLFKINKNRSEINKPKDIYKLGRVSLKQSGQLAGHIEDVPAQLIAALENNYGIKIAKKANNKAKELEKVFTTEKMKEKGVYIYVPVDTNVVMVSMPKKLKKLLDKRYNGLKPLIPTDPDHKNNVVVRFMTNGHTTQGEINELKAYLYKSISLV